MGNFMNHMVYIPPFTHPEISGVTFGGFMAGKFQASQPNATPDDDNPDVADSADPGVVPAITQPGVAPWRYITFHQARKAAANLGVGWHLMTAFEWASLALWSQANGTMPHGNNANTNPPADVTYTSETALLDRAGFARNAGWFPCLTGTGPNTWAHNHQADGVFDLNGNMWEWNDGLLLMPATQNDSNAVQIGTGSTAGHVLILGTLQITQARAPYGKSTATGVNSLTDGNKAWTVNEFAGMYAYDIAGTLHLIASNTGTVLTLTAGGATPAAGAYSILKYVATNISTGMSSNRKILTLHNTDANLKPFAIPATSDGTGATKYGADGYWFDTSSLRAAFRGGTWDNGANSGVFALALDVAPSLSDVSFGLRVAKSL